jgi:hypothetical protein
MKRADLLTAAGLVALLVIVAFTSPRWSRLLRRPARVSADELAASAGATPEPAPASEATRTINVKLFFEDPKGGGLVLEERSVEYHASLAKQLQVVVEELVRGSQTGAISPLAGNARVLEVFVTARGVAYVDLSKEISQGQHSASKAELLAVYSLVNSITLNFPAVKRVQILIDGSAVPTLAGHINLSRPLLPDMSLLAVGPERGSPPSS